MRIERLTFAGHDGSPLAARLDLPSGPALGTAIFVHCFTCGKDAAAARRIAARLALLGIAVLRFDTTGIGESGGDFGASGFTGHVGDILAASRALAQREMPPGLIVGHSFGGAAALAAAHRIASVQAVATIAAPADPAHVLQHLGALDRIMAEGRAPVDIAGRAYEITRAFVEDVSAARLEEAIRAFRGALLVMHAPRDEIVGIDNATRIFLAARHPKSFVSLDDADHLLRRREDAEYAADVIAAWAERYLRLAPPPPPPDVPEGVVIVSEADPEGFLQDIQHGPRHHLVADEPVEMGGTDRGPSPYGLVAAGLGACTSMTVRMYARRKGWPLEHVEVEVSHSHRHLPDSEGGRKVTVFTRLLRLEGPLDAARKQRLLEIADRCPVHRLLTEGARIETRLAEARDGSPPPTG